MIRKVPEPTQGKQQQDAAQSKRKALGTNTFGGRHPRDDLHQIQGSFVKFNLTKTDAATVLPFTAHFPFLALVATLLG